MCDLDLKKEADERRDREHTQHDAADRSGRGSRYAAASEGDHNHESELPVGEPHPALGSGLAGLRHGAQPFRQPSPDQIAGPEIDEIEGTRRIEEHLAERAHPRGRGRRRVGQRERDEPDQKNDNCGQERTPSAVLQEVAQESSA